MVGVEGDREGVHLAGGVGEQDALAAGGRRRVGDAGAGERLDVAGERRLEAGLVRAGAEERAALVDHEESRRDVAVIAQAARRGRCGVAIDPGGGGGEGSSVVLVKRAAVCTCDRDQRARIPGQQRPGEAGDDLRGRLIVVRRLAVEDRAPCGRVGELAVGQVLTRQRRRPDRAGASADANDAEVARGQGGHEQNTLGPQLAGEFVERDRRCGCRVVQRSHGNVSKRSPLTKPIVTIYINVRAGDRAAIAMTATCLSSRSGPEQVLRCFEQLHRSAKVAL